MISKILILITILLTMSGPVSGQSLENVYSCAMLDGNLSHQLAKSSAGSYVAMVAFPLYYRFPSQEAKQASQEAWKNWDGESPPPKDVRVVGVSLPLENSNILSSDIDRLTAKTKLLEKLFPPESKPNSVSYQTGRFKVEFKYNECQVKSRSGFSTAFCQSNDSLIVQGTKVDQVSLRMGSVLKQELIVNESGEPVIDYALEVRADLEFKIENEYVRTTFVYRPNGSDKQCAFKGSELVL